LSLLTIYLWDISDYVHVVAFVPRFVGDLLEHPRPLPMLKRLSVRSIPKPARGDPHSEGPTPIRDFLDANPFAVLTPPNDAPIDGAMSRESDSIDADADDFVHAVWYTTRRMGEVSRNSRTKRKGLGPPL
jgi:hypothetical protein